MNRENTPSAAAPVKGLVVAGGFSRRMGQDKALLRYHDEPQALWTWRLLGEFCREVWIGCRPDQDLGPANDLPRIHDRRADGGPMEGIAAAFATDPESAWLVVACDLPRLTPDVLRELLAERDSGKLATVFRSAHDDLPEPLCALYEPALFPLLEEALHQQRRCPRKVLMEAGDRVRLLPPRTDGALDNFNTPEEAAALQAGNPSNA